MISLEDKNLNFILFIFLVFSVKLHFSSVQFGKLLQFKDIEEWQRIALTALFIAGSDVLLVAAVHSGDRRLALEEALDVRVVVELVVARWRLRGGLAVVVLVMGRDLAEHHAVVLLQQGIA